MATKLIPKGQKSFKWKFPEDMQDKEATVFHIKVMSNRLRLEQSLAEQIKLIETVDDRANSLFGNNIEKIENVEGKELTERKEIIDFCLDRLSAEQGSKLELAITGVGDWLDKGLVKN